MIKMLANFNLTVQKVICQVKITVNIHSVILLPELTAMD